MCGQGKPLLGLGYPRNHLVIILDMHAKELVYLYLLVNSRLSNISLRVLKRGISAMCAGPSCFPFSASRSKSSINFRTSASSSAQDATSFDAAVTTLSSLSLRPSCSSTGLYASFLITGSTSRVREMIAESVADVIGIYVRAAFRTSLKIAM